MDDVIIASDRILRKVSLAVLLIDDLTGMPITGSNARAWIESEKPPVKKNDGWFVFTDLTPAKYTVSAEGGKYQKQLSDCEINADDFQTLTLRLKPARTYPVTPGCLRIEGKANPSAVITVFAEDKQSSMKLLADVFKDSSTIKIFHGDNINLEGGTFRIMTNGGASENLTVRSACDDDKNCYLLETPLKNDYPRVGSSLVPAAAVKADEKGRFFLILKGNSPSAKIVFEASGSNASRVECECNGRDSLSIDLRQ